MKEGKPNNDPQCEKQRVLGYRGNPFDTEPALEFRAFLKLKRLVKRCCKANEEYDSATEPCKTLQKQSQEILDYRQRSATSSPQDFTIHKEQTAQTHETGVFGSVLSGVIDTTLHAIPLTALFANVLLSAPVKVHESSSTYFPISSAGHGSKVPDVRVAEPGPTASASLSTALLDLSLASEAPSPTGVEESTQHSLPAEITPRDLWNEALILLGTEGENLREIVREKHSNNWRVSDHIGKLLEETENLQKACEGKAYNFKIGNKAINARDAVGKIVKWLNKFKAVEDTIVQFDQVHAALPWAAFRLLLEPRENLRVLYRNETSDTITSKAVDNLNNCMVKLYAVIIQMISKCHQLFPNSGLRRGLQSFFNPGELVALLVKCEQIEVQADQEASICASSNTRECSLRNREPLEIMQSRFDISQRKLETFLLKMGRKEWLKLLKLISNIPYGDHHRTVTGEQTGGTCEWLLRHKDYVKWREADSSSTLWIRELPLEVLKAFLRQLSIPFDDSDQAQIQKQIKETHDELGQASSRLNMRNCQDLLVQLIRLNARKTLVLDALDKVENTDGLLLVNALDYLVEKTKPKVLKIVISGRPDGNITWKLKSRDCVSITAFDNQDDISKFVKEEIVRNRHPGRSSTTLEERIISNLQEKSQGISVNRIFYV
ncbi:uncharacterized protein RSE6_14402 [Rhynchosporium secalis]|uniref:NWD NACHT-NTPase N-terminal domain-containing protein n=1 Tax=Rhynchosporium secalis TaxID=38038 RepID=A0A1E1MV80_RHYSE|nr:uncharacterized protein RSE6_14402 [Rhynchosporium secalis]